MALRNADIELPPGVNRARDEPFRSSEVELAEVERCFESTARALEASPLPSDVAESLADAVIRGAAFYCMAEDRGIAPRGAIPSIAGAKDVTLATVALFREGAVRYESAGMGEIAVALLDVISRAPPAVLRAIDVSLAELISTCRTMISAIAPGRAPDLLGHLYERSLARPAREARRASVKSLVRKEGGVFYTPSYVVDYVLDRTLAHLLEGKTPREVREVRVLDPACGSGAFLLGAYRELLAWHLRWYIEHDAARAPDGRDAPLVRTPSGEYRLGQSLRAEILENGIFGVDLDATAVDVAKLSLLLRCFDDGIGDVPNARDFALPKLHANLQSGDSLAPAEPRDLASFGWKTSFSRVFAEGGFDVVVGNPPYISFGGRHAVDIAPELRRYYTEQYESGGWPTAHSLFLERSVKLLSRRYVAFVVPDQVGHLAGYRSARKIGQREAGLVEVRYWGERVFPGVTTPAMTFVLDKTQRGTPTAIVDRDGTKQHGALTEGAPWTFSPAANLIERLRRDSFSLGKLVGDCGIRTTSSKTQVVPLTRAEGKFVPVLEGKLVERYGCRPPELAVRLDSSERLFVSRDERYRDVTFVIRQTASYPIVGPREHALYFRNSLLALFAPRDGIDVRYVVALLNSKLLRFVYAETVREANQRVFPQVKVKALQSLPLRTVSLPRDREVHDQLVDLVARALSTQRSREQANGAKRDELLRQFQEIDALIDDIVFDLYGVTKEERTAIEEGMTKSERGKT